MKAHGEGSTYLSNVDETRLQAAVAELQELIRQRYPDAQFCVRSSEEDPTILHLVATVDTDDTDVVLDAVVDRMMDFQIDEELPLFSSLSR